MRSPMNLPILTWPPHNFFYYGYSEEGEKTFYTLLADLGEARGCSTNTVVIKSVSQWVSHPFPKLTQLFKRCVSAAVVELRREGSARSLWSRHVFYVWNKIYTRYLVEVDTSSIRHLIMKGEATLQLSRTSTLVGPWLCSLSKTRRCGLLRKPSSSSCGGLWPRPFFALRTKKVIFVYLFGPIL